jgi:hypothetical protein
LKNSNASDIFHRAKVSIKIYLLSFVGISLAIPSHSRILFSNLIIVWIKGILNFNNESKIVSPTGFQNSVLIACSVSVMIKNEFINTNRTITGMIFK